MNESAETALRELVAMYYSTDRRTQEWVNRFENVWAQAKEVLAAPQEGYVSVPEEPTEEAKDAARYRWLRDAKNWTEEGLVVCNSGGEDVCYGDNLDFAIDAQIRAMLAARPGRIL